MSQWFPYLYTPDVRSASSDPLDPSFPISIRWVSGRSMSDMWAWTEPMEKMAVVDASRALAMGFPVSFWVGAEKLPLETDGAGRRG